MNTLEKLMAAGAENLHPTFTARVKYEKEDGTSFFKHEIVARDVDGTIYLTEEGKVFLEKAQPPAPKAARAKKAAPVVEAVAETTFEDDLAGLDLPD